MNRFQFVADHQRRYGVKRLCTILGIARSSFYYWRRTAADRSARQAADAALAARILAVHREPDGTYGVPRITAELRDDGKRINHKRIARVMRSIGLAGVRLRRRHRTTIPDPAAAKAPDLTGRDFTANEPDTKYVGDITYLPLDGGKFLYLATVIGLASRRLAGWAIADHMRTDLVIDALAVAECTRGSLVGAVMHTDHGAQGEFNWSSQHLDDGGAAWSERSSVGSRFACIGVRFHRRERPPWHGETTGFGSGRRSRPGPVRRTPRSGSACRKLSGLGGFATLAA
ncbi:IS3 family transposase [Streptomyces sp. SID625]|nr:IS3 family transposase [Streptomyces sp. SID625]